MYPNLIWFILPPLLAAALILGVWASTWLLDRPSLFGQKKSNRWKKQYKALDATMHSLEIEVGRLEDLGWLLRTLNDGSYADGEIIGGFVFRAQFRRLSEAELPHAPIREWYRKWTVRRWNVEGWPRMHRILKQGASRRYKLARDLQCQILRQEIVQQEARCRELQTAVMAICAELGVDPVVVFKETKPEAEATLPPATKREELQKLRVRVAELEEEVLAEQGGEGPLRRPAGIPRDN